MSGIPSLRRLTIIAAAYLAAALVASIFFYLAFALFVGPPVLTRMNLLGGPLDIVIFGTMMAGLLALIPALAVIAITEWRGWRHPIVFMGTGAIAASLGLAEIFRERGSWGPIDTTIGSIVVAAGAVAGLVFWTIAVHMASRHRWSLRRLELP